MSSMKKRNRGRKASNVIAPSDPPAQPNAGPSASTASSFVPWIILGGGLTVVLGLWLWSGYAPHADRAPTPPGNEVADGTDSAPARKKAEESPPPEKRPDADPKPKDPGGSFLEAFGNDKKADDAPTPPASSNEDLQKRFQELLVLQGQIEELPEEPAAKPERERLVAQLSKDLGSFEKEVAQAVKARPEDAVPEWLTGELLLLVRGEPDKILPHLRRAIDRGLARARAFASLARVQTETNRPDAAFRSAGKALDLSPTDRYAWGAYTQAGFNSEHFAEVLARLDRTFPEKMPDWARVSRREAADWESRWQAEQKLRRAEQRADDLPRVRLVIEHRRFARDDKGVRSDRIETTGRGEVVLELFEDQAPATVANFLALVAEKKYDGTRFHLALPAELVWGGDFGSRTGDPRDDGKGGPGYVIPDEFTRPDARRHFRGTLSMANQGPHTAGSQFFITLAPKRDKDGLCTVFGRVIKGQEVIDHITTGRTTSEIDAGGLPIIPGDLLAGAEVLRKRNHEYRVIKEPLR
jgi:peptidyl-prolyl cis-trans isomerase B (cyclophilin B)